MVGDVLTYLKSRGVVEAQTHPELDEISAKKKLTLYVGFDPTADSLHVGTLSVIVNLRRFQRFGHKVIAVIGGATAMLGDPSGRDAERLLRTKEEIDRDSESVKNEIGRLLDPDNTVFVNNYDWLSHLNLIDFLRDVGKLFNLKHMISRESVKRRLERSEGISYTEFTYQIFQAYDFYHLFKHHGCDLQMGGSDQWGNITAGSGLIHALEGKTAYGLTTKLIERSDGKKFAQSDAGGSIWLSREKTDVHQFYQFWFRTSDADFIRNLMIYTDLRGQELDLITKEFKADPSAHAPRDRFAFEMTKLVHGEDQALGAQASAQIIRTGSITDENVKYAPQTLMAKEDIENGMGAMQAFITAGLVASGKQFKARVGGAKINGKAIESAASKISINDFDGKGRCLLFFGKKQFNVLALK
jgi:tyrosyl-tRNA synthetase